MVSCDEAIDLMKEGAAKAFRAIRTSSMMTTMGEMKGMVYLNTKKIKTFVISITSKRLSFVILIEFDLH